ncbi:MAG: class I SAM-dependent methyltransferase [Acidimicrobiales bacterium]
MPGRHTSLRSWDASSYDGLALPHWRWGQGVLAGLALRGDERVAELGAGTGRDTEHLLARLERGHVVAVDGSAAMLDRLRSRLAGAGPDRLTVQHTDLASPWRIAPRVDAVFSVATLHWIRDHERLFTSIAASMNPGALLGAEWGGRGNLARVDAALADLGLPPVSGSCNFATAAETGRRLESAGFSDVEVVAVPDGVTMAPGDLATFLATVVLPPVLDGGAPAERAPIVEAVAARLPDQALDFVRLQARARR